MADQSLSTAEPKFVVPRQLSVRPDSPFYRDDIAVIGPMLDILLDGEVVSQVVTYDCDNGYIVRNKTDDAGRPMLNDRRDEVLTEVLHGGVSVRRRVRPLNG
jgi:hypothetical protein